MSGTIFPRKRRPPSPTLAATRRDLVEQLNLALVAQDDVHFPRPALAIEPVGPEDRETLARIDQMNPMRVQRAGEGQRATPACDVFSAGRS